MARTHEAELNAIVEEEDELFQLHKQQIEAVMGIVTEEVSLLNATEHPGFSVDTFVDSLDGLLERKMGIIMAMREKLSHFKARLSEEEQLSRSRKNVKVPEPRRGRAAASVK